MSSDTRSDHDRVPERGQAKVPRPPSREEIETLSDAQRLVTDDWTGEGGAPPPSRSGKG